VFASPGDCAVFLWRYFDLTLVAEFGAGETASSSESAMATTMKMPPLLQDEDCYEVWKVDLKIWCDLTDIPVEKQALAIHLTLTGRARAASQQVPRDDLKKVTGVKTVLTKLDSVFLVEKGRRQFAAFNSFHNYTRNTDDIGAFVSGFENVYFKFSQQGTTLPDTVLAFMLLRAGNLEEVDRKVVMSSIKEVTYENMKSALERIFCDDAPKLLLLLSCLFNHHAVKLKYDIAVLFGVTQSGRASK